MDVVIYVITVAVGNFPDYSRKNLKLTNIITYDRGENYIR